MKSLSNTLSGVLFQLAPTSAEKPDSGPRRKGARRQEIEADHRAAVARAYAYQHDRATSDAEREALLAEFEKRLAEGPDFTRYRRKSTFAPPPPHGLDRNALARLLTAFNRMALQSWKNRKTGRHRGLISRTCQDVFGALIFLAGKYPRLFPSLRCIARIARCSKDRVVAALYTLELLGFITRHRRLKLVNGPLGRKAEQDTNAYQLHFPAGGVGALIASAFGVGSESNNRAATAIGYLSNTLGSELFHRKDRPAFGGKCGEPPEAAPV